MDSHQINLDRACTNVDRFSQFNSTTRLRFSPIATLMIYITYLLPFCFGVFGNISVCLIFFQQKKLRSITNTFLMNLCLNDLIVLCVSTPMTLSAALFENWAFGAFLCKFVHFTPTLTALVSTFTVAIIAVERWFFIVNRRKFDRRCTILTLILLWSVSILIALPEFIFRELTEPVSSQLIQQMMRNYSSSSSSEKARNRTMTFNNYSMNKLPCQMRKTYYCVPQYDSRMRIFPYIVITVQYLVPFLFVSVSCYSISRFLKRRMIRMRSYHLRYRSTRDSSKENQKKLSNATDETTEQDVTSCDDLPSTTTSSDQKPAPFFTRFRHTLHSREQGKGHHNPLNLADQQHILRCQSHTKRRFHRSRKLLIYVAALFTISWLPLTIVQIYLEHSQGILKKGQGHNFVYGYLLIPCYLISSISSWINPVIYNYINRSFRREFYSLYSCCFKRRSATSRKEMTSIDTKRNRPELTHVDRIKTTLSPHSTFRRRSSQSVSFADETVVMMHRQT